MNYCFDAEIDRHHTDCMKADTLIDIYGRDDLMPMWIADMDFATPPFILEAIERRLKHNILGYSVPCKSYWDSIIKWESTLHGWSFTREELTFIPGIVRGIAYVIECFTLPGDKIVVQPPVYMPFMNLPRSTGRELLYNPLLYTGESYEMDFDQLESLMEQRPKLLILSNPHNPAGVVWSKETLARLAVICKKNGVIVISDEIHADMALFGSIHTPFACASEYARDISITFASPSKTFNMAGLMSSFAVVHNSGLRSQFFTFLEAREFNAPMFLATIATQAAFTQGAEWRKELLAYLEANVNYVCDYLDKNLPGVKAVRPQASFLVWLDCRGTGLDHKQLIELFVDKAHLALNDGATFGPGGEGFMRLNVGCPRSTLKLALEHLSASFA